MESFQFSARNVPSSSLNREPRDRRVTAPTKSTIANRRNQARQLRIAAAGAARAFLGLGDRAKSVDCRSATPLAPCHNALAGSLRETRYTRGHSPFRLLAAVKVRALPIGPREIGERATGGGGQVRYRAPGRFAEFRPFFGRAFTESWARALCIQCEQRSADLRRKKSGLRGDQALRAFAGAK